MNFTHSFYFHPLFLKCLVSGEGLEFLELSEITHVVIAAEFLCNESGKFGVCC